MAPGPGQERGGGGGWGGSRVTAGHMEEMEVMVDTQDAFKRNRLHNSMIMFMDASGIEF